MIFRTGKMQLILMTTLLLAIAVDSQDVLGSRRNPWILYKYRGAWKRNPNPLHRLFFEDGLLHMQGLNGGVVKRYAITSASSYLNHNGPLTEFTYRKTNLMHRAQYTLCNLKEVEIIDGTKGLVPNYETGELVTKEVEAGTKVYGYTGDGKVKIQILCKKSNGQGEEHYEDFRRAAAYTKYGDGPASRDSDESIGNLTNGLFLHPVNGKFKHNRHSYEARKYGSRMTSGSSGNFATSPSSVTNSATSGTVTYPPSGRSRTNNYYLTQQHSNTGTGRTTYSRTNKYPTDANTGKTTYATYNYPRQQHANTGRATYSRTDSYPNKIHYSRMQGNRRRLISNLTLRLWLAEERGGQ